MTSTTVQPATDAALSASESRRRPRFEMRSAIVANFAGVPVTIRNMSDGGLGIESATPLRIGSAGPIRIDAPENSGGIAFRGRVVWSRLTTAGNGSLSYLSGVRVEEESDAIAGLFGRMIRAHGERRADGLQRKQEALNERARQRGKLPTFTPSPIPAQPKFTRDQLLMIEQARKKMLADPAAVSKLYERAKETLVIRGVIPAGAHVPPYRKEVVATWEYLEGKLELELISAVLAAST